jgi:hypothetical protein
MFLMYVLMCDLLYGLQELGCSANEKSLERYLGEAQKKHFKHTNARYNTEDQLDDRNLRIWQLRDLLHVAGLTLLVSQHNHSLPCI